MKRVLILGVAALVAFAGCGSSSSTSSSTASGGTTGTSSGGATAGGGGGQQLALASDPSALKYDKTSLNAKAGKVTITMTNKSPLQHDVAIKGGGVNEKGSIVGQGGKSVVTATLKAGSYTFYCSVDGHAAAGMKGTLTVK